MHMRTALVFLGASLLCCLAAASQPGPPEEPRLAAKFSVKYVKSGISGFLSSSEAGLGEFGATKNKIQDQLKQLDSNPEQTSKNFIDIINNVYVGLNQLHSFCLSAAISFGNTMLKACDELYGPRSEDAQKAKEIITNHQSIYNEIAKVYTRQPSGDPKDAQPAQPHPSSDDKTTTTNAKEAELTKEIERLKQEVDLHKTASTTASMEIATLGEQNQELRKKLALSEKELKTISTQLIEMTNEMAQSKEHDLKRNSHILQLELSKNKLEQDVQFLQNDVKFNKVYQQYYEGQKQELRSLKTQNDTYVCQLNDLNRKILELEKENKGLNALNAAAKLVAASVTPSTDPKMESSLFNPDRIVAGVCVVLLVTVCLLAYMRERTRRKSTLATAAEEGRSTKSQEDMSRPAELQKTTEVVEGASSQSDGR